MSVNRTWRQKNGESTARPQRRASWITPAVALLALGPIVGCPRLGPGEREALSQAAAMYERGDTSGATQRVDKLIADFGNAAEIGEAYYIRGLCRIKQSQPDAASQDFQAAIDKTDDPELEARCQASLAAIAYNRHDWAKAARLYKQAVDKLPDEPPKDRILYYAGGALQRNGQWKDAMVQFSRVLSKFPNSSLASNARRKVQWRHEHFAIQVGAFGNYANAARVEQSMRARGLNPSRENLRRDGQSMWVVMVGQYRTYAQAEASLSRIRQFQPDAIIIP